ncbi:MAG TPA: hypothetical protein VL400_25790 [Polyangiaceae bacterium]|nr:hypothetical protein [Polyangiaceae bacterium]
MSKSRTRSKSSPKRAAPAPKKKATKKATTRHLAVKYESDGMSIGEFEKLSAKRKGLSVEEWRKASLDALKKSGKGSDLARAAKFLEDRNWTDLEQNPVESDGAMKGLLDTSGYSSAKGDLPSQRQFWRYLYGKKLALEADWQYKTSVSFVTRDADGKITSSVYADTSKLPSLARHAGASNQPMGSFMKVVTDKDPNNPLAYGRILDGGSLQKTEAEVGIGMARNLGDASPNPAIGPTSSLMEKADVTTVAANPTAGQSVFDMDGMLDNEHTQYAGWLAEYKGAKYDDIATNKALDETMEKYKDDPDFKAYQERVKAALKKQAEDIAAGDRVETGEKTQVFVGEERRELATKGDKTRSGDELKEGVQGVYAGKNGKPVGVVGTGTVRGNAVKNGAVHVEVGGPQTTREMRPGR